MKESKTWGTYSMSAKSLINWTRTSGGILILKTNLFKESSIDEMKQAKIFKNKCRKMCKTYMVTSLTISIKANPLVVFISDIPAINEV